MDRDSLIASLRSVLDDMLPASERYTPPTNGGRTNPLRIRYNDYSDSLKMFSQFLSEGKQGSAGVDIDEALMGEFLAFLAVHKPNWSKKPLEIACCRVRKLINELPEAARNRNLLSPADFKRMTKFDCFTKETQEAIRLFLADGRRLKRKEHGDSGKPILTGRLLTATYRNSVIEHLQTFLKTVGKDSVFDLDNSDADKYLNVHTARGNRQVGINNLADVQPFFANLWARGSIDRLPFNAIFTKSNAINNDFVPPDQLAVLQDISKVNLKDFSEVRDRLLAICFCYDFALRIGEVVRLKVSDVVVNEYVELTIRTEVQKGSGKQEKRDYSYFPESKVLMTAYLKLRKQKRPTTDALIVTERGVAMLMEGCRNAIQKLCQNLGVKTFKGAVPAPHRFRHSFGTCNVSSLGLQLDIYAIMRRLRHTNVELTSRIYVTDNPLLTKANHDAHSKAAGLVRIMDARNGRGQNLGMPGAMGRPAPTPVFDDNVAIQDFSVTESRALRLVIPLGITLNSLRKHAEGQGTVERNNGKHFYSRQFIENLSSNYFTKQKAMRVAGLSRSGLSFWVCNNGIETVVIGKASLLKKDDVLARISNGNLRKTA
jgi:site-specific recombinase XerC